MRWSVAEGSAMKAPGIKDREVFRRLFYDRALKFAESRQDILSAEPTVVKATDRVLRELEKFLRSDPDTASFVSKSGAWSALEKFYRQTATTSALLNKTRADMGGEGF